MFIRELNIKGYCFSSCAYSRMGFAAKCMTSSNGIKVLVLWCCTAVLDVDTVSVCVIQMYFAKLSHAVVHFFKKNWISHSKTPGNSCKQAIRLQSFSNCVVINFNM